MCTENGEYCKILLSRLTNLCKWHAPFTRLAAELQVFAIHCEVSEDTYLRPVLRTGLHISAQDLHSYA